jgi:cell division protein FtsN
MPATTETPASTSPVRLARVVTPAQPVVARESSVREVAMVATPVSRPRVGTPSMWIQVGAYRNAVAAGRVAAAVNGEILVRASTASTESPLLRVRVGPFTDRALAVRRLHELQAQGWKAFIAESRD